VIGGPERAAALLREHLSGSGADEMIATTNTHALEDRLASYERLTELVGRLARHPSQSAA
jgi:hypothetical protein